MEASLIQVKIFPDISAPQFRQVIFDNLPVGMLGMYDYNRGSDIPYTFGWENDAFREPEIITAKDAFGNTPPHASNRVLAWLLEANEGGVEAIREALIKLDVDFCRERELIIAFRECGQIGILIRRPLILKLPMPPKALPDTFFTRIRKLLFR